MSFLNLMQLIYLDDVKNLPRRIVALVYGSRAVQNQVLLASVWNRVMSTLTLATLTKTAFFDKTRQEILVLLNLGKNKIFLRARRCLRSGFPYILRKTDGLCCVDEIDTARYDELPIKFVEQEIDVVPWLAGAKRALDAGDIEIGGYHIVNERRCRLGALQFHRSYEYDQQVLQNVIRNSINYAIACPYMVKISAYKGRLQLAIPVIDAEKRLQPKLSLIVNFDSDSSVVAVPTILRTDMVALDLRTPDQIYLQVA